jgi:hypothetical protein
MPLPDEQYWPFPTLPAEKLTERQRNEVAFLEEASSAQLRPSQHAFGFTVRSPDLDREADIIRRSYPRDWWELIVYANQPTQRRVMSGFVTGFQRATSLAMLWVNGSLTDDLRDQLSAVGTRVCIEDGF